MIEMLFIFETLLYLNHLLQLSTRDFIEINIVCHVAAPGSVNRDLTTVGNHCADHMTPLYPQKLALTSPTGGGHSVGIVRSRTKAMEFIVCHF
jgi:hypothetical protein